MPQNKPNGRGKSAGNSNFLGLSPSHPFPYSEETWEVTQACDYEVPQHCWPGMFRALCQASHTAVYPLLTLLLINKPVIAPLPGVTPDKISMQHKPKAAAKQNMTVKWDSTSGKMDHYYPGKPFHITLLYIPRHTE